MNVCQFRCVSIPFGFEGGMWDLLVLVPDYCFSFTFLLTDPEINKVVLSGNNFSLPYPC